MVLPASAAPGHDYVLVGRAATLKRPFAMLVADLHAALRRLRASRAADPGRSVAMHEAADESLGALLLRTCLVIATSSLRCFLASCRYSPSCSAYALEALQRHGALGAGWLAVCRVSLSSLGRDGLRSRS